MCVFVSDSGRLWVLVMGLFTSYSSSLVIGEELEIKKSSSATGESREDFLPSTLLLIAMCKLDMDMLERD